MSPGAPSAPVSYIPTPTPAITYQSLVPKQSYQDAAEYLRNITGQLNKQLQTQYQQVGTPAEIGARQAGIRAKEAASYLASMPRETFGTPAYESLQNAFTQSQQDYGAALEKAKTAPAYNQFQYAYPMWATHSDESWAVKPDTSKASNIASSTTNPTEAEKETAATSTTQGKLVDQYRQLLKSGKTV